MEGVILIILLLVVAAVLLYPIWRRYQCGGCTTTTSTPGHCFPAVNFPVQSGLIDLRNCNDTVYILGDRSRVKFIEIVP